MKAPCLAELFLFVIFLARTTADQDDCPPWFFSNAENGTGCVCSNALSRKVKCSRDTALLRIGNCMTYNQATEDTEIGLCPYISNHFNPKRDNYYLPLPNHTSNLTTFMCGSLHRTGQLCGECEDGFGPALYSYTLECKKCWGQGAGWLLYITLTVIPTTVLYIIVVVFHVSATSPPLSAFILFCHVVVYTFRSQSALYLLIADELGGFSRVLLKVMLSLCGLWNLDFLRPIVHPFCVSPHVKNLPAFALEYIEAFYPLILILITYICIKLHDHNFRPVVLLWKPFHRCFVYFRRSWDSQASLTSAFATFLLLSFSKILFVSFTLLYGIQVRLVNRNGTFLDTHLVMYYDSTVKYFSDDHLPFAAVSICVGLLFIVFPILLLILYPTRIFRKCITCCRFRRYLALHTFIEAFQGQYKDGTNGTRDFRIVSALYLVFRIAVLFGYSSNHNSDNHAYGWQMTAVVCGSASLFFSIIRPYKVKYFNAIDSIILALPALLALICQDIFANHGQTSVTPTLVVCGLLIIGLPHATLMLYILYIVSKKIGIYQCLIEKCRCLLSMVCRKKHSLALDTDSLPDRLVNPDEYEPLIPAAARDWHLSNCSSSMSITYT